MWLAMRRLAGPSLQAAALPFACALTAFQPRSLHLLYPLPFCIGPSVRICNAAAPPSCYRGPLSTQPSASCRLLLSAAQLPM